MMAVTQNHGGYHAWDITAAQAKGAEYVSYSSPRFTLSLANFMRFFTVVQCRHGCIRFLYHVYQAVRAMALPTSFLAYQMESLGYGHIIPCRNHVRILRQHNSGQDLGMYTEGQNIRQLNSRALRQVRLNVCP